MIMKKFTILAFAAAVSLNLAAQKNNTNNVLNLKQTITDNSIVYPESFESDTQKLLEGWYLKNYTDIDPKNVAGKDPGASDEVIKARLAEMQTVIEMPFNQIVRSYIDKMLKGRGNVTALLGLSTYYMPIFEQALEEARLPMELKYLPIIESGLNPNAVSKSGAAGLWQFMVATGKGLGMEVTSLVDERRDPYIASEKACSYLKDLYKTYGKWDLAIAAYNCGPGTVNKALRRAGGNASEHDYWSIYYYLPTETRGYVPAFIAANYVMTYYPQHNISPVLPTKPVLTDTVHINQRVHFEQISGILNIPVEDIRTLNPQFRQDIIPASQNKIYNLTLPMQQVQAYIVSEDEIVAFQKELYAQRTEVVPGGQPAQDSDTAETTEDPYNPADLAPAMEVEANQEALVEEQRSQQAKGRPRRHRNNQEATQTSTGNEKATQQATTTTKPSEKTVADNQPTTSQSKRRQKRNQATTSLESNQQAAANQSSIKIESKQQANNAGTSTQQQGAQATAKKDSKKVNTTTAQEASTQTTTRKNNKSQQASQQTTAQTTSKKDKKKDSKKQTAQTTASTKKQAKKQAAPKQYEVKSGESLSSIAKKTGMTVDELRKQNPKLKKTDVIHPGDKLNVTGSKSKANDTKNAKTTSKKSASSKTATGGTGKKSKSKKK